MSSRSKTKYILNPNEYRQIEGSPSPPLAKMRRPRQVGGAKVDSGHLTDDKRFEL